MTSYSFDKEIAKECGVHSAILLNNIIHWVNENRIANINYHNGKYWTFNTVKKLSEIYGFLSEKQIRTAMNKLADKQYIEIDNFNKMKYDKTLWYTVGANCPNGNIELPKLENGSAQMGEPIPNINTNINTDTINSHSAKSNSQSVIKKKFIPPSLDDVKEFVSTCGHSIDAEKVFRYYDDAGWKDSRGTQVKNWKQKIRGVWCRDENKIVAPKDMTDAEKIKDFHNFSQAEFRKKYGLQELIRIGDIVGE